MKSRKKIQIFLMSIMVIYLQVIWLLLGFILIPLFSIVRGLNKVLDALGEYEINFATQLKEITESED